jgi:hypothetical protein
VITPRRRAVTRFFVPLIDVLILLFCIFLLMPFVSGPPTAEPADTKPVTPKEQLPEDVKELQRQLTEARDRLARMEKLSQARLNDRLSVRVLQIDRRDGTVYYFDPDRQEIRTAADALRLIDRQRTATSKAGGVKDLFFLFLLPTKSSYPTQEQVTQIRQWFKDVPIGFDTASFGE